MIALACVLVFCTSVGIAYAHARYAKARDELRPVASACWDVASWAAASVGFIVAVKLSLWSLPFEAAGLFAGTVFVVRRSAAARQRTAVKPELANP